LRSLLRLNPRKSHQPLPERLNLLRVWLDQRFLNRPICHLPAMSEHLEHLGLATNSERSNPHPNSKVKTTVAGKPKTVRTPASKEMRADTSLWPWLTTFAIEHQHSLANGRITEGLPIRP